MDLYWPNSKTITITASNFTKVWPSYFKKKEILLWHPNIRKDINPSPIAFLI